MIYFISRTLKDLRANFFLNSVTVITIALAVLIFSAFTLLFVNADALLRFWLADLRIMVYLKNGTTEASIREMQEKIRKIPGVGEIVFIPKAEALERFRKQLGPQASLADGLSRNPLPDALEIQMDSASQNWDAIEPAAEQIAAFPGVEDVEYGAQWLSKFIYILHLFRLTAYAMGGLFFLAAVFFVANTIRLVLYSRREEIEIMRLVGASDGFIKDPFYIQALFMGMLGGLMGLGGLFCLLHFIVQSTGAWIPADSFHLRFLPTQLAGVILAGSMFVGWIGCFVSLRQFLK
ncbi:MAG: permease-like cell division protein FtsX [Desulfobacterales bacterium]